MNGKFTADSENTSFISVSQKLMTWWPFYWKKPFWKDISSSDFFQPKWVPPEAHKVYHLGAYIWENFMLWGHPPTLLVCHIRKVWMVSCYKNRKQNLQRDIKRAHFDLFIVTALRFLRQRCILRWKCSYLDPNLVQIRWKMTEILIVKVLQSSRASAGHLPTAGGGRRQKFYVIS